MQKTSGRVYQNNLWLLLAVLTALVLGCTGKNVRATDDDAPKVERGRLKFSKSVRYLNIGLEPVSREVTQYFFVQGKEWKPDSDPQLADRINWCDTSPNPQVEILRCFAGASENYQTTYILRMKNDKPDFIKIDEGLPSIWIDDDGRWLLFGKSFLNVETGEKIDLKVIPVARQNDDSIPVGFVLGVSPDRKTIATIDDTKSKTIGGDEFVNVLLFDVESGRVENRTVNFSQNPWLKEHQNPDGDISPPPPPSKKLVWEKDAAGKYSLIVPKSTATIDKIKEK